MTPPIRMSTINLRLPTETRNRFKVACAHQEANMRETLIEIIQRFIKWEREQREPEKSET